MGPTPLIAVPDTLPYRLHLLACLPLEAAHQVPQARVA
jgi:hypothetical protein